MQLHRLRDLKDPVAPELAAARALLRETRPLEPSIARMQRVHKALTTRVPPPAAAGTSLIMQAALALLAAGVAVALILWARERHQPHAEAPIRREPTLPVGTAARQPPTPLAGTSADAPAQRAPLAPAQPAPLAPHATHTPPRLAPHPSPLRAPHAPRPHAPRPQAPHAPPAQTEPPSRHLQSAAAGSTVPDTAASPPPSEVRASVQPMRAAPQQPMPPPAADTPDEVDPAEAALVLSATQMLRQRGEPARALALLSEYQSRFPRGALQEEVLALRLECLVALSDQRAGAVARDYLDRYPSGRFREFAAAAAARYPARSPRQE